jgi:hypothetical protein
VARCATSRPAFRRLVPAALAILLLFAAHGAAAKNQSRLEKEQANYASQNDPVHKAKILAKLGTLELEAALRQLKAGHDDQALAIVRQYRDQVSSTTRALLSSGHDAVNHPAGFKELQIGVRQCLDRLNDMILAMPVEARPWFRAERTDLMQSQNTLIDALFPSVRKVAHQKEQAR